MYPSEFEFLIPDGIESMTHVFFTQYCLPFVDNTPKDNADLVESLRIFQEHEKNPETPFFILEIIKEILIDKNAEYEKFLIPIAGNLNRIAESGYSFSQYLKANPDYKSALESSVLFLLPYAASYFQETDEITLFDLLFSTLICISCICERRELFNRYINFLFSDLNPHGVIIILNFGRIYGIDDENKKNFCDLISTIVSKLPECDLTNTIENLTYNFLFSYLSEIIGRVYIFNYMDIATFLQPLEQYLINFTQKYEENDFDSEIRQQETDLIEKIVSFISVFLTEFSNKSYYVVLQNRESIATIMPHFSYIIFKYATQLIISSKYLLSPQISRLLIKSVSHLIDYDEKNLFETEIDYFINLIFQLTTFSQEDYSEISQSEESFFFDFYDIDFTKSDQYSSRQSLSMMLHKYITKTKSFSIINYIAFFLRSVDQGQLNEQHFFLLSVLNHLIAHYKVADKNMLLNILEINGLFLNHGSEIVKNICGENSFEELPNILFIYTFYFLINSSFYLLSITDNFFDNSSIYELYNNEICNLMNITQKFIEELPMNNYSSIFFTMYCIFLNNLIDHEKLAIPEQQLNEIVGKYYECCFTNHGIKLIHKASENGNDPTLLLQSFYHFYENCQSMIAELINMLREKNEKGENEEEDLEVELDRDSEYIVRYFGDNVSKMSKIILIVDYSAFDEQKLKDFSYFLTVKGKNNWPFYIECIDFMSAILSKAPNMKEWTEFYVNNINESERVANSYSEFFIPIISGVSNQPELVDQQFFDHLLLEIKKCMEVWTNKSGDENGQNIRIYMATWDALLSYALIIRLFEISLSSEIAIQPSDVEYFVNLAIEIMPNANDEENEDIHFDDQDLQTNILKLAGYLALPDPNHEEILALFTLMFNNGQIICPEIRYMIIYLIDNVLNSDDNEQLAQLRESCLNNKTPKDQKYVDLYRADSEYFANNVTHPIYKLYAIENFVINNENDNDDDEDNDIDDNNDN